MRCLQANMQYLSTANTYQNARPKNASTMAGPAVMDAPVTNVPKISELYEKLRALFPGWKGLSHLALANAQGATRGSVSGGVGVGQQAAAQVQGLLNQTPNMSHQQMLPQQQNQAQTPFPQAQGNMPSYTPNCMQNFNNPQMQNSMGTNSGYQQQQQPFTGQMMGPGQGLAQGLVGRGMPGMLGMSQQNQGQSQSL